MRVTVDTANPMGVRLAALVQDALAEAAVHRAAVRQHRRLGQSAQRRAVDVQRIAEELGYTLTINRGEAGVLHGREHGGRISA